MVFMIRILGLLMVMVVGCGSDKDSPTGIDNRDLLIWTTTYDGGEIKEEYQYYLNTSNNKRVRDGWYNSYSRDGNYKEVGIYKDDKKEGKWVLYYNSGEVLREENFVNGKKEGKEVGYDINGNINYELIYKDGECVEGCV